jgi:hypothetical protein
MGDVLPLIRKGAVDGAWASFQEYACKLVDDSSLITNRSFMEEMARRERIWKKLFWAGEA